MIGRRFPYLQYWTPHCNTHSTDAETVEAREPAEVPSNNSFCPQGNAVSSALLKSFEFISGWRLSAIAMPISDMRQDGNGLDTMGEIDSNGSCDSVVSFNSCFSDESLEYLSAEEKACLMYLEETIQSLDTEDDSGLSNDESLQLPERGNVANKAAHLSASITLNKLPSQDMPKSQSEGLYSSGSFEQNSEILNYMVPTPFVLANHNSKFQTRHGLAASQKNTASKVTSESAQIHQEAPRVPPEVNVVVIPPPRKTKSSKETKKEQQKNVQSENVAHRGPLSYEALVQLRKSASMRKTNASEANYSTNKDLNEKSQTISQISKPAPPPVAPKPKKKLNQEGASGTHKDSSIPYSGDKLMNPEKVRVEALCKLGLLKEDAKICKQLKQSQSQSKPANQTSSEHLAYSIPARPEEQINQSVQRCSPLHQRSVSDLFTSSSHTQHANMTAKSATLERTGMGLSESNTNAVSQSHRPRSSTIATNKDTQMDANESTPRKPFNILSSRTKVFSVPVPSIGKDRREALRKLGLLKN